MSAPIKVNVNPAEIKVLEEALKMPSLRASFATRIKVILARINNISCKDIATVERIHLNTVTKYVHQYNKGGIEALLQNKTKPPGKNPVFLEVKQAIIKCVCTTKPENATHWSNRALAKKFNISNSKIHSILKEYNLKPHLKESFSFSKDPEFEEKLADVVGLYLEPPRTT